MAKNKQQDVKEKILQISMRLFLANGFRGTTVKELTDAAGIAKGTLYWYFSSKDEVLENVIDKFDKEYLQGAIEKVNNCEDDFVAKFKAYYKYTTEFTRDHPELMLVYSTLVGEIVGSGARAETKIREIDAKQRAFIKTLLDAGKKEGIVRKNVDAGIYAHIIMAIYAGMLLEWYINKDIIDARAYSRSFREFILNGLVETKITGQEAAPGAMKT